MQIGFEVTAARPKGLRAAADQPAQVPMRPATEIRRSPSTDQKKVRRANQRKTASMEFIAALNDVGDCRLCGGDLKAQESSKGDTTIKANCADCGTEHHLQGQPLERSAALAEEADLDAKTLRRLANVDTWLHIEKMPCPDCHGEGFGTKRMGGHDQGKDGFRWHVLCKDCGHKYSVSDAEAHADRKQNRKSAAQMLGFAWVAQIDTSKYVTGGIPLSAIARRAQQVSSTPEENL